MRWKLGINVAVHPGQDELVKTVTVKCDEQEFKRPIIKVSVLPFKDMNIHTKQDPTSSSNSGSGSSISSSSSSSSSNSNNNNNNNNKRRIVFILSLCN
jgi:hypothetical protein